MSSKRNLTRRNSYNRQDSSHEEKASVLVKIDRADTDQDLHADTSDGPENQQKSSTGLPAQENPSQRPKLSVFTKHLGSFSGKRRLESGQLSAISMESQHKSYLSPARTSEVDQLQHDVRSSPHLTAKERRFSMTSAASVGNDQNELNSRSGTIISTIDEGDLSDFKDLQDDFNNAMESGSTSWLPQIKTDPESSPAQALASNRDQSESVLSRNSRINSRNTSVSRSTTPAGDEDLTIDEADIMLRDSQLLPRTESFIKSTDQTFVKQTAENSSEKEPDIEREAEVLSPLILCGNSVGIFSAKNRFRLALAKLLLNKWARRFHSFLLVCIVIVLSVAYYNSPPTGPYDSNTAGILLLIINILYTLEIVAKVIAFGFWDDSPLFEGRGEDYKTIYELTGIVQLHKRLESKYGVAFISKLFPFKSGYGKLNNDATEKHLRSSVTFFGSANRNKVEIPLLRAYTRSSWNRVELVSTASFWISLFLSINDYDFKHGIRIFRALAALRILKLAAGEDSQSPVLRSLKFGLPQLINVCFMLLYFWVFFGILGVQSFQGSMRRTCVWTNPDEASDSYTNSMQFCGGYLEPGTKRKMPYIFTDGRAGPIAKGFICPEHSKCVSDANPYNGRVSFDNILSSMELVFVTISANTFTDIMYYTMDSDSMAASLFFISCIFLLNIWMINLMIAVLVSSFEKANEVWRRGERKDSPSFVERARRAIKDYIERKADAKVLPLWSSNFIKWYERFQYLFVMAIAADLVMQATLNSKSTENMIETALKFDRAISFVLLAESLIRIICYVPNLWKFLRKANYVFDLLTCIITIVITAPIIRSQLGHTYYWLNIFNIVRFYRVITMIKVTRKLWKQVLGNAILIWNLSGFYFLFLFLVSIIMTVYFEGTIPKEQLEDNPFSMFSLPNSFLTLFIVGSTENWTESLYALQEYAPNYSSQFFGSVLLILWFFLANFVMLNIFIAIIAESLDVPEKEKRPLQIKHYLRHVYPEKIKEYTNATLVRRIKDKIFKRSVSEDSRDFRQFLFRGTAIVSIAQQHNLLNLTEKEREEKNTFFLRFIIPRLLWNKLKELSWAKSYVNNPFYRKTEVIYVESPESMEQNKKYSLRLNEFEDEKLRYLKRHPFYNHSYYIFPHNHIFRKFCQSLTPPSVGKRTDGQRFFEDGTSFYNSRTRFKYIKRDLFVGFISVSTVFMVVYSCFITPLYRMKHSVVGRWSVYCDAAFVAIFSLEFIIKTVADGLVHTPNAYLRNPWNCIDIIVLISILINFVASLRKNDDLSRVFKGLTALRALRCLTISKTARSTFNQVLFDGLGKIIGAATVSLTLLFPFAVWGLGIFRGRLGTCNDQMGLSQCYNEYTTEVFDFQVLSPRVYSQPYLYMDSLASSFRSLYEIVSLEGWVDILSNSMASTGIGTIPEKFATPMNGLFFVLFNFLSMVFILTLFVSFIIRNHARTTGSAFLTIEEKSWLEVKRLLSQVKPEPTPEVLTMSSARFFIYRLAVEQMNFWYALFLQFVLYLHIVTLLLYRYRETNTLQHYQDAIFMTSTTIFLIQEVLYVIGKGTRLWWLRQWDVLKLFVMLAAFCLNIARLATEGTTILGFTHVRDIFQLAIFLLVIPQNDVLSELINTAKSSMPSILSLTYTWGILFLVYAIALNQIFGLTRLGANTSGNLNFRTVVKSLIVLFRCSFGEGWNYIMDDLTVTSPFCYTDDETGHSDCGSKPYAYVLLMSWNVLSMYIFLNMFVSLILENFSYLYHAGSGSKAVARRDEVRRFKNAWKKFDPDGIGEIEHNQLPRLMHSFDGLLSFKIWEGRLSVKNLVSSYMTVNPLDPYDVKVDLDGLNKELLSIDQAKIIERKQQYRRFIQEAHYLSAFTNGTSLSRLILQVPLYTTYKPQECLGIDDFVKRLYVMGKVDKFLENERNVDVLKMVVTRWKFLYEKMRVKDGRVEPDATDKSAVPSFLVTDSDLPGTPHLNFSVNNFNWSPRRVNQERSDSINAFLGIDEAEEPGIRDERNKF
ncbi:LADA_0H19042g1_1 [Lachancea dasiensis]|uniref:Calcium-channel protein CCH1 n=1 Tax=Lachancea dasiensis TaxID=1072105 RepID=A0A1G4K6C1_9SACH|nr:LADA_0H19042g1_1 [Lachancea dasiensis]